MIEPYSACIGFGCCLVVWGIFEFGKLARSRELQRIHEARADLEIYFASEEKPKSVSWFPRDGRSA